MPKLGDKHYEYTEKGKAQYKKDKKRLGMAEGTKDSLLDSRLEAEEALREIARKNKVYAEDSWLPDMYTVSDEYYDADEQFRRDYPMDAFKPSFRFIKFVQRLVTGEDGKMLPEREVKKIESKLQEVIGEERLEEREPKQIGGPAIDEQMADIMPEEEAMPIEMAEEDTETMLPDEEMEGNYIDFVIDEALEPEEEQYLLDRLSGDEQLSMIFDKVVETASEFAGSGLVEGPGSAVSDSIPARLSDGEFVMTSKAANQIGPDNLQSMMEEAEMVADENERRIMQSGGYVIEEEDEAVDQDIVQASRPKEVQRVVRPVVGSLADRKVNESMIALNPRNSLFAR